MINSNIKVNTTTIPLFPLNIVVLPREEIHLNIFESRYRQLIHECYENEITFGTVAIIDKKISAYGTLMNLKKIIEIRDDGSMHILVEGINLFKLEKYLEKYPNRLYPGGKINNNYYIGNHIINKKENNETKNQLISIIKEIFLFLKVDEKKIIKKLRKTEEQFLSFELIQNFAFKNERKLFLLSLSGEEKRRRFLIDYFNNILKTYKKIENIETDLTKNKINYGKFNNL